MKLTKQQLKEIIKEEMVYIIAEITGFEPPVADAEMEVMKHYQALLDALEDSGRVEWVDILSKLRPELEHDLDVEARGDEDVFTNAPKDYASMEEHKLKEGALGAADDGGKNYSLGPYNKPTEHKPVGMAILDVDFNNLKDVGENMPGGVDPKVVEDIIRTAFEDAFGVHAGSNVARVTVNDHGGGGYRDPSRSKYRVVLQFDDRDEYNDFATGAPAWGGGGGGLAAVMVPINDAVKEYALELRQYELPLGETTKLTKQQFKQIVREELSRLLKDQYATELLPNGLLRVRDRRSGLVGLFNRDLTKHSGDLKVAKGKLKQILNKETAY